MKKKGLDQEGKEGGENGADVVTCSSRKIIEIIGSDLGFVDYNIETITVRKEVGVLPRETVDHLTGRFDQIVLSSASKTPKNFLEDIVILVEARGHSLQ